MKTHVAVVVFFALSIPVFAKSLSDSGNAFLAECSALDRAHDSTLTDVEKVKNMQCLSYVEGLIDGATYELALTLSKSRTEGNAKTQPFPFCRPEGAGNMQLLRVALKYVRDNPEKAHLPTAVLIFTALQNSFPCSEKKMME